MNTSFIKTDTGQLTFPKWKALDPKIEVGFTTRKGGMSAPPFDTMNMGLHVGDEESAVIGNRKRLAHSLHFPLSSWVIGEQVHGAEIAVVSSEQKGRGTYRMSDAIRGVDGLITKEQGVLCAAFFADCVPVLFFDPVASIIGIAHAGWKGTVLEITGRMIEQFTGLGSELKDIHVIIGPAISQENYEVDDRVTKHIDEKWHGSIVQKGEKDRYFIDLQQLNMEILLQYGILRHNIDRIELCTYKESDLFYSHRRDGGKTGRMLGYIGLREE